MRQWIWHRDSLPRRRLVGSISMILDAEPAGCWRRPHGAIRSLVLMRHEFSKGRIGGPRRAQPESGSRRRSLALIHIWRPSVPRTRPHHSPRSRTQ